MSAEWKGRGRKGKGKERREGREGGGHLTGKCRSQAPHLQLIIPFIVGLKWQRGAVAQFGDASVTSHRCRGPHRGLGVRQAGGEAQHPLRPQTGTSASPPLLDACGPEMRRAAKAMPRVTPSVSHLVPDIRAAARHVVPQARGTPATSNSMFR